LNNLGYSLTELSVVLALITIITALVISNVAWIDAVRVRVELDTLCITAHYLQQRACAMNKPCHLIFDISGNAHRYENSIYHLPQGVQFGVLPGTQGPPAHPERAVERPVTFIHDTITFYPDGIIKAGAVYVCDAKKTVMYALSSGVATVSYLRKYQYNGQWHLLP
jgi:prepilin-type N-terminal cleavage/methylation domain-containing protein